MIYWQASTECQTFPHDTETVQDDLTPMGDWIVLWQIKFHADKCNVLTVTNKRKPLQSTSYVATTFPENPPPNILTLRPYQRLEMGQLHHICDKAGRTPLLTKLQRNLNIGSASKE